MSLMKWFRRNNRKIIAVAVVGLLVVWLGGSALRMTCSYAGPRQGKAVALFGKKNKITIADINRANSELAILRQIGAERILHSQNIQGFFLAELLFSEGRTSPMLIASLQQLIRTNQLRISNEQILNMSKNTEMEEVYWHLLKKEAEAAGIAVSNEAVANVLRQIIPRFFEGDSYSQVINRFINRGIPEETVLSTFAQVFAVTEYAKIVCSGEQLTRTQISRLVSDELQTIDTRFVAVRAELFADEQAEPGQSLIREQFDKYKAYYPGEVTQDNPYGFGYKLDNRVQLEYIIVKLDDIEKIIEKPTQQEKEQYYLVHTADFPAQRPSDPNDPNSPPLQYTMSFGQVAELITSRIITGRIMQTAEAILNRAKLLAEEKYGDSDAADLTAEQMRELAADFGNIADKLAEENSIKVYSGKTGLLSIPDAQADANLAGLLSRPTGPGRMPYSLVQQVFSVGQPDSVELALSGVPQPKIYEALGPFSDIQGKIVALVRVVDVKKAAEPADLNVTFNSAKVKLGQSAADANDEVYSVREQVVKDLKDLAAMQAAKEKAEQFLVLAQKDGWEKAIETFNRQYPPNEPNEPNNFEITVRTNLKRPSVDSYEALVAQTQGLPGAHFSTNAYSRSRLIFDTLSGLVPDDSNSPKELPVAVEVKPDLSYYCIESLSVNRIDRTEYDKAKALIAYSQDNLEIQNLGAVYFQPGNILKRMNFRRIKESQPQAEPNKPADETAEPSQGP